MLRRILFSIFSLLVVVIIVMLLVYSLIDRKVIFQSDDIWNKKYLNDRTAYEYSQYEKFGYMYTANYGSFLKELYADSADYENDPQYIADKNALKKKETYESNASVQKFIETYTEKGYEISYLEPVTYSDGSLKPGGGAALYAIKERFVLSRLWDYIKGFFTVETTNDVKDPNLTERYIRFEDDPYGWFAVVGSGTTHKYLLYFDDRFPFIHQNFIHLNLGVSHTRYRGEEISTVITTPQGKMYKRDVVFPTGLEETETAIDMHSLKYNYSTGNFEKQRFTDNYTTYTYRFNGLSRLENSFVAGFLASILAYLLGLPLGILMARKKDTWVDKLGNVYVIFIMAVPSLAYIFMFAAIGTGVFRLPYLFANAEPKFLGYILPIVSLALPSVGGLMKWMRRYMIDQMNSDYVKFARSQGLSEREIYRTHISRNAMIYIVHGIPGTILGSLTGAIVTERVYGFPGVGNLLTEAITRHDNSIIVAVTVFYTTITIVSIILGDLLLAKYDPRISLSSSKGGGR